jgi:hypothetical protein
MAEHGGSEAGSEAEMAGVKCGCEVGRAAEAEPAEGQRALKGV